MCGSHQEWQNCERVIIFGSQVYECLARYRRMCDFVHATVDSNS